MPELPDVTVYVEALRRVALGQRLARVRLASPFLLRSVAPPVTVAHDRPLVDARRLGKRVVLALEGGLFLVIHLMIAGRLQWKPPGAKLAGRSSLAAFDFDRGTLLLTEAGSRHRAALHVVEGDEALRALDPGGVEPLDVDAAGFGDAVRRERRTLKRALTDPRLFSGIGNAYSDEILHRARLSPLQLTSNLDAAEVARLHEATRSTLLEWTERLRKEAGAGFPSKVTALREGMAVHGRYGKPCPVCGTAVQRVVRAENECNYCPRCQTEGRLLADRAFSKLLHDDWPRTIEEWEGKLSGAAAGDAGPRRRGR